MASRIGLILALASLFEVLAPVSLYSADESPVCGMVFRLLDKSKHTSGDGKDQFVDIRPAALTGQSETNDPFLRIPIPLQNLDIPFVMELRRRFRASLRADLVLAKGSLESGETSMNEAHLALEVSVNSGEIHRKVFEAYSLIAWAAIHHEKPDEFFGSAVHGFNNILTIVGGRIELLRDVISDQRNFISGIEGLYDYLSIKSDEDLIKGVSNPLQAAARTFLEKRPNVTIGTIDGDGHILPKVFPDKLDVTRSMTQAEWEGLAFALEELVWNAMKYSDGTYVGIYAARRENRYIVVNGGPEIPDSLDPFAPGARADEQKDKPGTGYGLSSVVSVLESIGWEVVLESRREPTRFVVRKKK